MDSHDVDFNLSLDERRRLERAALSNLPLLSDDEVQLIKEAALVFEGDSTILSAAIGLLLSCKMYGYRVVKLSFDQKTITKYEKVFRSVQPDFRYRSQCSDFGPLTRRSVAFRFYERVGRWWDIVTGKVPGRGPQVDLGP